MPPLNGAGSTSKIQHTKRKSPPGDSPVGFFVYGK
nr:MAG TPA: hypothetical protein [Caudoviricetes sp.]